MKIFASVLLLAGAIVAAACGGGRSSGATTPRATPGAAGSSAPAGGSVVASGAADASAPPEHPMAKSTAEASELIDKAVESHQDRIKKCVDEFRARGKDPHAKVVVELGIDQEGMLIGVKSPKGAPTNDMLLACVKDALKDALFPRSHAGVITVKKTFEDVWVYPK
jgi:hypothetical protein